MVFMLCECLRRLALLSTAHALSLRYVLTFVYACSRLFPILTTASHVVPQYTAQENKEAALYALHISV